MFDRAADDAVVTEHLDKRFRRVHALRDLSLRLPDGSIMGLVGPNGAGKTTLLKLLVNLLTPDAGRALVLGVDTRRFGPAELARIGYVSENQQMPEWMTVRQLLDFCRPLYATWDASLERRLLTLLDLPEDRRLKHLSRGMRMKAALISSLAYRPRLLVMDEPFGGLDPVMRDDVARAVLELANEQPLSVLVSSHDLHDIEPLIDAIAYLRDGQLQFAEPIQSLQARVRQIDIVSPHAIVRPATWPREWMNAEVDARALRFVHPAYREMETERELAARFPDAQITATPVSLRDTFLALERHVRRASPAGTDGGPADGAGKVYAETRS